MSTCVKCNCNQALANLGYIPCPSGFGAVRKIIFVPLAGSTGALNFIDTTTEVVDQTYLDGKISASNPLDRWYPSLEVKNYNNAKSETVFETFNDGSKKKVRDGVRTITGLFTEAGGDYQYACKLNQNQCGKLGVYLVDECDTLQGMKKDDSGKLYPIPVQAFDAQVMEVDESANTSAKISFTFEFVRAVSDCALEIVETEDADVLGAKGLLDANLSVISSPANTLTFKVVTNYGPLNDKVTVKGLVLANVISLLNVTTATALTPASLTEDPLVPGKYVLTYTGTVATGNVLKLTLGGLTGYDFANVSTTNITVA